MGARWWRLGLALGVTLVVGCGGDAGGGGGDGVDKKCSRVVVCCAVSYRGVVRCVFFSARDEKIH